MRRKEEERILSRRLKALGYRNGGGQKLALTVALEIVRRGRGGGAEESVPNSSYRN